MAYPLEHHDVYVNDPMLGSVRLHVVQAGPTDGPLLMLLHGFPEFWYGWHRQIGPLADAGYRVWVPDGRGYNRSDKPAGIEPYRIDQLAADVLGLLEAAGRQRAVVVGHDWGAAVAWWLALTRPDRIERLVVLNVPHPYVFGRFASTRPAQMLRSWYIAFFQLPRLPEWLLERGRCRPLVQLLRWSSRPGTFARTDLTAYQQAWSGSLRSMIGWYRAAVQRPPTRPASGRIRVPTLLIWGARDAFLLRDMAQPSIDYCEQGRLVWLETATHWVQHEEPDRVTALILAG